LAETFLREVYITTLRDSGIITKGQMNNLKVISLVSYAPPVEKESPYEEGVPKTAIAPAYYQCRIKVKKPGSKEPQTFDSSLVFPVEDFAKAYLKSFKETLKEKGYISTKGYKATVIELTTYLPEVFEQEGPSPQGVTTNE
jgi:hypothetical protein